MTTDGRAIALTTLIAFERTPRPVDDLLAPRLAGTPPREAALATTLVQGVLRWQGLLDGLLAHFVSRPLRRLDRRVRVGLRFALFQMRLLDRIPPYAAINETIELLKQQGLAKPLIGFVNGVLRTMTRANLDQVPLADHQRASLPRWLYDRWQKRWPGDTCARLCATVNKQAPLCLTVLTDRNAYLARLAAGGVAAQPAPLSPLSVVLPGFRGAPDTLPGYLQGEFIVQDQGAAAIAQLLFPAPPGPILDACAGVGGKAIALAALAPERRILACEPNARRFQLLRQNLERTGLRTRITPHPASLADFCGQYQGPPLAAILVDAPCSGTGIIRRHPEIRWLRRPKDLSRYQHLQGQLLGQAATLLAPHGVLVYATCSTEPEENEMAIDLFLGQHPQFIPDQCGPLCTLPLDDLAPDGFFAIRLRRCPSDCGAPAPARSSRQNCLQRLPASMIK